MKEKINLNTLLKMKENNEKVAWVTAYDYPFAQCAEDAGIDMILVGDSGGMTTLGYSTTNPVTMNEMISFAKAVRRGAPNTFIIGDMPQGSYEISNELAITNALRFIKEAGCDAIKLEGGLRIYNRVQAISNAGILVMGHLGLTPQSVASFGGYRVQGKTKEQFEKLIEDSKYLQDAGAFSILLEAIPLVVSEQIVKKSKIPIYGVGGGTTVDGQLVIMHDLVGFYKAFRPFFAKCYIPEILHMFDSGISRGVENYENLKNFGRSLRKDGLSSLVTLAISQYIDDVKNLKFPTEEYSYPIKDEELQLLKLSGYWSN